LAGCFLGKKDAGILRLDKIVRTYHARRALTLLGLQGHPTVNANIMPVKKCVSDLAPSPHLRGNLLGSRHLRIALIYVD
jgi:hypothetical protein